jgi:aminoglycoside phosphotransferase (APT) family kinase protein
MTDLTGPELTRVRTFMAGRGAAVAGDLTAVPLTGGRSNLTYRLDDGVSSWVLRRPPRTGRTHSAHDVARELTVTRALEPTGFPVPRSVGLCSDETVLGAPFTVVDHVAGRTVRGTGDLAGWDADTIDRCVDGLVGTLAALHRIDFRAAGLGGLLRPGVFAERQLRRWSGQWETVGGGFGPDADRLRDRLAEQVPGQSGTSVVHGDFRIDNVILDPADPGSVRAVVDWELSTVGDPVADVAVLCAYRHPALDAVLGDTAAWTSDRLPAVADLAGRYEKAAGTPLEHWDFHLALAYYKLAVISAGIVHRHRAGATTGPGFDTAGDAVGEFVSAGLGVLR